MDWKKFLNMLIKDFRTSVPKLARATGLSTTALYKIKKGGTEGPNQDTFALIEKALNIKIMEDADGNLSYKKLTEEGQADSNFGNSLQKITYNSFPVVTIVRAGQPNGVREEEILYYAEFNYTKREGVIAVLVEGDSMEPELKHGDIVLVDKFVEPTPDCIVVAVFNSNDHTIKKFRIRMSRYIPLHKRILQKPMRTQRLIK